MDVVVSEDQKMLQDTARRFAEKRVPLSQLRREVADHADFGRDAWRDGAALGWMGLFVPENQGGLAEHSAGAIDAAIIAEELGRVVYSGPFLPTNVVAFAIAQSGTAEQKDALLPGIASGEQVATWCIFGPGLSTIEAGAVTARRDGDAFLLDGSASYVEAAAAADHLLVSALGEDGPSQFILPARFDGVTIEPLQTLDLGRTLATVRFDNVRLSAAELLGEYGKADAAIERQLQLAVTLQCAENVGAVDRALEFTLDWVKQRFAFGRPIGSFQALKHRLADHAAQLEVSKALTAYAAKAVHERAPDAAIAVSIAKSQCGRFAVEIVRDCLHMHGGIGMTFEHDVHFYLRRVVSNEALWGSPVRHHDRICRLAGL